MAEEKTETYKLKDQTTSFYDDETGLTVTRDEEVKIGMTRGKRTLLMINRGGLIRVDTKSAQGDDGGGGAQKASAQPKSGPLPDDFPHAKVLAANNITTFSQLHRLNTQQLVDLNGIGDKKAEEIEKALGR